MNKSIKQKLLFTIVYITSSFFMQAQTFAVIGDYGQNVSNPSAFNYQKHKDEVCR